MAKIHSPFFPVPETNADKYTPLCLRGADPSTGLFWATTSANRSKVTCRSCLKLRPKAAPPVKAILKDVDTGAYTLIGEFPTREEAKAALVVEAKRRSVRS